MGNVSNADGTLAFPDDDEKGPHSENGFFTMSALYGVCLQYLDHLESLIDGQAIAAKDKVKEQQNEIMTVVTENLEIAKKQIGKFDAKLVNTQTFLNDEQSAKGERRKSRKSRKMTNPLEEAQRERMKNAFPYGLLLMHNNYTNFITLFFFFVFFYFF